MVAEELLVERRILRKREIGDFRDEKLLNQGLNAGTGALDPFVGIGGRAGLGLFRNEWKRGQPSEPAGLLIQRLEKRSRKELARPGRV